MEPHSDILLQSPPKACPKCGDQYIVAKPKFLGNSVLSVLGNVFKKQ